ncbi:MAG: hypothetical protein A3D44_00170 [Candidatus Staskawiczbacteria bacterium RIFCSPHIGHO2_02_FULL_42_22]|uniref:UDP-N-acetylglucosamine--LPS N-acetylglucosamine transferase n=1 Tax=Candidatus Staskawiczbacteria bacterium RIFCSPHIGHO2_02_FULL_42_22 TaxID=1802207 RepID=A0A1G2I2R7_9BACT|nr:MAG: hypothetical protein A3D44_00170 [Candidatus Staskawiczbacteria bacterium RIFCSPHIGHO2_02_FULL_42_22]
MNKKHILIMSMTGGFGHVRAGEALLDYAKEHVPEMNAEHVDITAIDPSLKKYAQGMYGAASKKFPFVWKILYNYPAAYHLAKKTVFFRGLFNSKVKNYIYQKKPDAIIFTNVEILPLFIGAVKKKFPHIVMGIVVTDYHGHPYYKFSCMDYYFVAHQDVADDLKNVGIKQEKIKITGIPINPGFYVKENIGDLKLKYGIKNNLPVVLLITSFQISSRDLIALIENLLALDPKINVAGIANGSQELYDAMKNNFSGHQHFCFEKWTNTMEEYMKISDVVVSKAGGLTVSECVALAKPLVVVNPIPGQEEFNTEFLEKNNLGVRVKNLNQIPEVVRGLLSENKKYPEPLFIEDSACEKIFQYF